MTNADHIRQMDNEDLVSLLVWRSYDCGRFIPSCDEGCEYEGGGCALNCPHERRERSVRKWLEEEWT